MDQLELLKNHVDTVEVAAGGSLSDTFFIEPVLISGAVLVKNVPITSSGKLREAIENDVKLENVNAVKVFAKKQIIAENPAYTLMTQEADSNDRANLRFLIQYTGPKLKEMPSGVYSKKADLSRMLLKLIRKHVSRLKLEFLNAERSAPKKPVDISFQSAYLKFVARHTDYEMVFKIIPNRKQYGELAVQFMPKVLDGITIREQNYDEKTGQSSWKMNAAGMPYLVRIGKALDNQIKQGG